MNLRISHLVLWSLFGCASSAAWALPARAEPNFGCKEDSPLQAALSGQAQQDYMSGCYQLGVGNPEGARLKFASAYNASGDARLLWSQAVCENRPGHYVDALALTRRYLQDYKKQMTESERKEAEEFEHEVRRYVTSVFITVNQIEAEILVDGVSKGITPLKDPLLVEMGTREVRARKSGFSDEVVVITSSGGQEQRLDLNLRPAPPTAPPPKTEVVVKLSREEIDASDRAAKRSGIPTYAWIGGGAALAVGIFVGYLLLRPAATTEPPTVGTLSPGTIQLPLRFP